MFVFTFFFGGGGGLVCVLHKMFVVGAVAFLAVHILLCLAC